MILILKLGFRLLKMSMTHFSKVKTIGHSENKILTSFENEVRPVVCLLHYFS